jgi:hypothetical protein
MEVEGSSAVLTADKLDERKRQESRTAPFINTSKAGSCMTN